MKFVAVDWLKVVLFLLLFMTFRIPVFADDVTYNYDDWGRLTYMSYEDSVYYRTIRITFTYDDVGNFQSKTVSRIITDSDGDTLPNGWESHYGLNP